MNKNTIGGGAAVLGLVAIAGIVAYRRHKRRQARTGPTPIDVHETAAAKRVDNNDDRINVQNVSVTKDPSNVTDAIYKHFLAFRDALSGSFETMLPLINQGRLAYLPLEGRTISEAIEQVVVSPKTFLGETYLMPLNGEDTALYALQDNKKVIKLILVQTKDLIFSIGMHDDETFVATGPVLESFSTMAYLELLLEVLADEFGFEGRHPT